MRVSVSGSHRYGQAGVRESHGQSLARFLGEGFVDCDGDNQLNISAASGFVLNALGTADLTSVDPEYASVGRLDAQIEAGGSTQPGESATVHGRGARDRKVAWNDNLL